MMEHKTINQTQLHQMKAALIDYLKDQQKHASSAAEIFEEIAMDELIPKNLREEAALVAIQSCGYIPAYEQLIINIKAGLLNHIFAGEKIIP